MDYATDGTGLNAKTPSPNNNSSEIPTKQFTPGSGTDLNDGSGLKIYAPANDKNKYLVDSTGKALFTFKGGTYHTIKGKVYLGEIIKVRGNDTPTLTPTTNFPVTFSDLAYCVFPVTQGESDYICYFGGACTNGGSGCPQQNQTYEAINGGWYGKVGLIEPGTNDDNGQSAFQGKKVCFAEDIQNSTTPLTATAANPGCA